MKVTILGQPFTAHGGWMASWLESVLANTSIVELHVAVAWVKRSGLSRLEPSLDAFRARGGTSTVILGIDEGGATEQGLRLAMQLFDSVYVFHEPGSRTYHPKVYVAKGYATGEIVIGSNNMTAGGLYSNYEASLRCELELSHKDDRKLLNNVLDWFNLLCVDANVCKLLTEELLDQLLDDPRYRIGNEDRRRPAGPSKEAGTDEDEDDESITEDSPGDSLFGPSSVSKAGMAPPVVRRRTVPSTTIPSRPKEAVPRPEPPVAPEREPAMPSPSRGPGTGLGVLRWRKRLAPTDAQQPPQEKTNPTGNLRLAKAGNDIDHKTFFREKMFGNLNWTSEPDKRGVKESVTVPFDVVMDGKPLGEYRLDVDHATYRIAEQNNVPTVLHWGDLLPILREKDYRGYWVLIERRPGGKFRLEITRDEPDLSEVDHLP